MRQFQQLFFCLLVPVIFVMAFSGCGRKAPPKPPENFAPRAVQFFTIVGTVDGVLLKWAKPDKKADGESLDDLSSFVVYRASFESGERPDYDELTEFAYEAPKSEGEKSKPLGRGEKGTEQLEEFSYLDRDVSPGEKYLYYVVADNEDGVSGLPSSVLKVTFIGEATQVELFTGAN